MRILNFVMLFCLSFSVSNVLAETKKPALATNMDYADVLKSWGAPESKEEHEIKRREVWIYGKQEVVFESGQVVSWKGEDVVIGGENNQLIVEENKQKAKTKPKRVRKPDAPVSAEVVDEILSEIMKEPSSPDSPDIKTGIPQANIVRPNEVQIDNMNN